MDESPEMTEMERQVLVGMAKVLKECLTLKDLARIAARLEAVSYELLPKAVSGMDRKEASKPLALVMELESLVAAENQQSSITEQKT